MRHNPDRGIMGQLVQDGAIEIDLVMKDGLRRHLHHVARRHVKGLVAADVKGHTTRRDHVLGDRDDLALGKRHRLGREAATQTLALRDVEHGEAFEERHSACAFAGFKRLRRVAATG
ncbi:hypothetical protein ACVWYO_004282 [Sphingomonas sp. UYP23]